MVRHWGKALGILLLIMLLATVVLLPSSPDIMGADSGWSPPQDICHNSGISQAPRIAVDGEKNLYVVWKDYTPGYIGILCRIKPSSGWSALEQIPGTSSSSGNPGIAVDHDGRLHVVWKDNITGESGIFWTTRTSGGNWSAPQKIPDSSGNSTAPDIAVDAQGNPHVVWEEDLSAESAEIMYATRSDETNWLTQNISNNSGFSRLPSIAVDNAGNRHVVWQDDTIAITGGYIDILYATTPSSGNWSAPQDISHSQKPSSAARIAIDSDGNPYVVWERTYDQYATDIRVQYTTKSGSNWLEPETISPSTGNITLSRHPCIAIDNTGKPNVVWEDMALGYYTIAYTVRHSNGDWLTPSNISQMPLDSSEASMAIDASGNIHVVWQQSVDIYNSDIFYATLQTAPPNQPSNIYPADGATGISLTPILKASDFSDPEEADALYASRWQISTTMGNFTNPVFDKLITSNSTQLSVPPDVLVYNTTYYWQVRYQDSHGSWSSFSNETSFTTTGTTGHSSWLTRRVIGAIVGGVIVVLAVGIWLLFRRRQPAPG